jgi:hypothetical protein
VAVVNVGRWGSDSRADILWNIPVRSSPTIGWPSAGSLLHSALFDSGLVGAA